MEIAGRGVTGNAQLLTVKVSAVAASLTERTHTLSRQMGKHQATSTLAPGDQRQAPTDTDRGREPRGEVYGGKGDLGITFNNKKKLKKKKINK